MRFLINSFLVSSLALVLIRQGISQNSDAGGPQWAIPEHLGQPRFRVELVERVDASPDICRLDVFVEVVHDYLQFVRKDSNSFEASIDISVSVEAGKQGEIFRQISTLKKSAATYEQTNSRSDYLTGIFSIEQPPGDYTLKVLLADKESGRREKVTKDFSLKSKSLNGIALSQIMLMKTNEYDIQTRFPSQPLLGDIPTGESNAIFLFYDLLRPNVLETCSVFIEVTGNDQNCVYRDSLELIGGPDIGLYTFRLPTDSLQFGKYFVTLTAVQNGSRAISQKTINVNARGVPGSIRDLDLAIKQLRYIASEKEIDELKKQFTSDRESAFIAFWNEKLPSEGEKINGKMVEYYSRINYADENFTSGSPGWETDRGRILVTYGKPTEIERNVFEKDGVPYEVWYYNHLGKTFTFKDEYGFGDYRLVTPAW